MAACAAAVESVAVISETHVDRERILIVALALTTHCLNSPVRGLLGWQTAFTVNSDGGGNSGSVLVHLEHLAEGEDEALHAEEFVVLDGVPRIHMLIPFT